VAVTLAGPGLIVLAVAVVLHGFVFQGRLSTQHPDVLAFWTPTYCFLGKSLAGGHIPGWNPFAMGGVPFAADPQSGWMNLPAMALFAVLSCGVAMRTMLVLQPILGGLGVYWFARSEGLSRPAATTGGLALALGLSASRLVLFLPFPSYLAWTAVLLAACSRFFAARTPARRLLWALATAVAWGQLAAAHFSQGILSGTAALAIYAGAKAWAVRREGSWTSRELVRSLGILAVALPMVNLAFLLPRLAYLPGTSFKVGSSAFAESSSLPPDWPLRLATWPGFYFGAVVLVMALASLGLLRSARSRPLVLSLAGYGLLSYLAASRDVVRTLTPLARRFRLFGFYTHFPARFGMGLLLAIPVLAAAGVDAWRNEPSWRRRVASIAPGIVVWLLLTPALGASLEQLTLLGIGTVLGAGALALAIRRPGLALLIPLAVAVELTANGLAGQSGRFSAAARLDPYRANATGWFPALRTPDVGAADYLRPGPIASTLQTGGRGERFLSLDPMVADHRGYLSHLSPRFWGLLANQRGMLFGLQDAQGYNPVQLARYWSFVRAVSPGVRLDYTAAAVERPPPVALDLLQVGWVVGPAVAPPLPGLTPEATDGEWILYRRSDQPPRASVLSSWRNVSGPDGALQAVIDPAFDPSATAVVEGAAPAPNGTSTAAGQAVYRELGPQAAVAQIRATAPSLVLIRNAYDPNWHATLDGRGVPLLHADYVAQGVMVPAGDHTIALAYDDPWIGYGMLGSAIAVALLAGAAYGSRRRATAARSGR
jgi:hypothetical protein